MLVVRFFYLSCGALRAARGDRLRAWSRCAARLHHPAHGAQSIARMLAAPRRSAGARLISVSPLDEKRVRRGGTRLRALQRRSWAREE